MNSRGPICSSSVHPYSAKNVGTAAGAMPKRQTFSFTLKRSYQSSAP
ncbi:hypothetical protein WME75_19050 [Sorangium sp. So ce1014]